MVSKIVALNMPHRVHYSLPIDGEASNIYFYWNYMEMIGHANCCFKLRFILPPYAKREKKHLNIACCFSKWWESNPGRLHNNWVLCPFLHCLSPNLFPPSLIESNQSYFPETLLQNPKFWSNAQPILKFTDATYMQKNQIVFCQVMFCF